VICEERHNLPKACEEKVALASRAGGRSHNVMYRLIAIKARP
jgi:hypothetical protein